MADLRLCPGGELCGWSAIVPALSHLGTFSEARRVLDTSPAGDMALNRQPLVTTEKNGCWVWPEPQPPPLGHHTPCNVKEALRLLILRESIILGERGLFLSFLMSPQVGPSFESRLASTSHIFWLFLQVEHTVHTKRFTMCCSILALT